MLKKIVSITIFYAIIRFSLHMLVINIDGKGRVYSFLLIFSLFLIFYVKGINKKFFKPPFIYWFIWIIYAFINTMIQGMNYDMQIWQFATHLIAPGILLIIFNSKFNKMSQNLIIITIASYINVLIILFFEKFRYFSGEGYRLGLTMNANELGIDAFFCILFLYLLYRSNMISLIKTVLFASIPLYVIIRSGSRAAFVPFLLLVLGHYLIERLKITWKTISAVILGIILFISFFNFVIKDSLIYERLRMSREEGIMVSNTGTVLDYFGSRSVYYLYGSEIFNEYPLFGVGLGNYRNFNPISRQPNHVEVMIQLSELGIFGFILYIFFNLWIIKNLLRLRKKKNQNIKLTETYLAGILLTVALGFTTYTHAHILAFCFYGITISYILKNDRKGFLINE